MKIFISWSGARSQKAAESLSEFLAGVIPPIHPWVSSQNLQAGDLWFEEIAKVLNKSGLGIVCLTKGNLSAPWLYFEAGALRSVFGLGRVCPLILDGDLSAADIPSPLSQFQSRFATRHDVLKLVQDIKKFITAKKTKDQLNDAQLAANFAVWWPKFEQTLDEMRRLPPEPPSPMEKLLEEIRLQQAKIEVLHDTLRACLMGGMPAPVAASLGKVTIKDGGRLTVPKELVPDEASTGSGRT